MGASNFWARPGKEDAPESKKEPEEQKEFDPTKRHITLANGEVVELDDLKPEDKLLHNKRYTTATGKGYKQKFVYKPKQSFETIFFPAVIEEEPDWAKKIKTIPKKEWTEKQKQFMKNTFTKDKLLQPVETVKKNKNNQGLYRYVFWNEIVANKNGILYYSIPLLLNVIFLLCNAFKYNFLANILLSLVGVFDILCLSAIRKSDKNFLIKMLLFLLLVASNVGLYFLGRIIPGLYNLIDVWYTLKLFLICICIYHFAKFYAGILLCYHADCKADFGNVVQINAGKPRCGKTSTGVHEALILARLKWEQLKFDAWLYKSREKEIFKRGDIKELLEYHEVMLAYNFYTKSKCIPCLWSNIGVFDKKGRASHQVTIEHIKGIKRLPVYSVVFLDEIGAVLKSEDGLNRTGFEKPFDVSDMFRLGGHFLKWAVIGCEQDFNHVYIDCRRVVGFNRIIHGQEWVCRPTIAYGIYKFLKMLVADSLEKKVKPSPILAEFMTWFGKFVHSIGFRRIKYSFASNTETKAGMTSGSQEAEIQSLNGVKTRWVPSCLCADYDDRAYKELYASYFDKKIEGEVHKRKSIDGCLMDSYQFVNSTSALEEKRDAVREAFKKIA